MGKNNFKSERMFSGNPKWKDGISRSDELYKRNDDLRSEFYRDYTRILHCQPYRRLKHKTQVFFATQNDHICTRMEHVQHVASVSYTIAKYLGLDLELTQAIALGHDIGHAPFGHEGEMRLRELAQKDTGEKFWHEKNGVFVCDRIATLPDINGIQKNLDLTYAVRDGIISHCGEIDENGVRPRDNYIDLYSLTEPNQAQPYTWEACVVKIADKIAYLGRDIEDALEQKFLSFHNLLQLKKIIKEYAPDITVINNTVLMHNLIIDFCKNSTPEKGLCLSGQYYELIRKVKDFNYENIYNDDRITSYKQYSGLIIQTIYSFLRKYYRKDIADLNTILRRDSRKYPTLTKYFEEWLIKYSGYDEKRRKKMKCGNSIVYNIQDEQEFCRAIIDYIAGMTDNFAIKSYHEIISF